MYTYAYIYIYVYTCEALAIDVICICMCEAEVIKYRYLLELARARMRGRGLASARCLNVHLMSSAGTPALPTDSALATRVALRPNLAHGSASMREAIDTCLPVQECVAGVSLVF